MAEIVRLYKIEGWTQQQLADKFNVSRSCIQTKVKSS
ncbi:MAG: HTH domain-containing protein [Candidatus Cloacimonetes bacterium]|nr:HTH domain-containing protein [Candidatus Cloacimonadota bacterium]